MGSYLMLGSNQGLLRFDKKSHAVRAVQVPDRSLSRAPVYTISKHQNSLLVAFDRGELATWDISKQEYNSYLQSAAEDYITDIAVYNGSYIAGSRRGLYQIDHGLNHSSPVKPVNSSLSLAQLHITSITELNQVLWVATMNQGILGIVKQDNSWHLRHHLTTENGLQENQIRALEKGSADNLWVATATEIMQLNPRTMQIKHFSHLTHWLNMEYHANAAASSEEGAIAFGGNQGVLIFNPGGWRFSSNLCSSISPPIR